MISLGFRFDDPGPGGDVLVERRVIEAFQRRRIPLCIAVVPFRETSEGRLTFSKNGSPHVFEAWANGGIEIALHGNSHRNIGQTVHGAASEFAGVARELQIEMLKNGRDHLSSIFDQAISGFVPPFNTYDQNTIDVAKELGFRYISAGSLDLFRADGIALVPSTSNLRSGRAPINESLHYSQLDPTVIFNFHPDNFHEFKFPPGPEEKDPVYTTIPELEDLLDWLLTLPNVEMFSLSALAESAITNKLLHPKEWYFRQLLPWRISKRIPKYILLRDGWRIVAAYLKAGYTTSVDD